MLDFDPLHSIPADPDGEGASKNDDPEGDLGYGCGESVAGHLEDHKYRGQRKQHEPMDAGHGAGGGGFPPDPAGEVKRADVGGENC